VELRIDALAVTALEGRVLAGRTDRFGLVPRPPFPWTPGWDAAGAVERVGDAVGDHRPGDRVVVTLGATTDPGLAAGHATVPADHVVALPDDVAPVAGAVLVGAGTLAQRALDAADPRPGDAVVVTHAATPVGRLVVALAVARDLRVTAVVPASAPRPSPAPPDGVRTLDDAVPYAAVAGFADLVVTEIDDDGPMTEHHPMHQALAAVAPRGTLVCLAVPPPEDAARRRVATPTVRRAPHPDATAAVLALVATGRIAAPVDAVVDWPHAPDAYHRVVDDPTAAIVVLGPGASPG